VSTKKRDGMGKKIIEKKTFVFLSFREIGSIWSKIKLKEKIAR